MTFANAVDAKEFFASRIVEQGSKEGAPLSDLERKMLYFTEIGTDAKPEYLEVAEQFDSQYVMQEYEDKIKALLEQAYESEIERAGRVGDSSAKETWRQAYEVLSREDHYILVMINEALGSKLRKKRFGIF